MESSNINEVSKKKLSEEEITCMHNDLAEEIMYEIIGRMSGMV